MLSAGDAALVARDREIPGLDVLLDADAASETLSRLYPDAGITRAEPRYVRYKRGTSCLVAYVVHTSAGCVEVYARAYGSALDDKVTRVAQVEGSPSPLGAGVKVVPKPGLAYFPFPNDHELAALRHLGDESAQIEMLREALPASEALWTGRIEPLRYKPERRFVARLSGTNGTAAALKFYTRADYEAVRDLNEVFTSTPPLRVARPVARAKRFRMAAVEWLDGETLQSALVEDRATADAYRNVGIALAVLHGQSSNKLRARQAAEDYAESLTGAATALAGVVPRLHKRATRLAERLGAGVQQRYWREGRAIHGDLSSDQILLTDDAVGVVDFDRASKGDPRIDLGTFAARLSFDVICGAMSQGTAETCNEAVVDAYRETSEKDVTRGLRRFTAASLLRMAVEPFRFRHVNWPDRVEEIVARAEALARRRDA